MMAPESHDRPAEGTAPAVPLSPSVEPWQLDVDDAWTVLQTEEQNDVASPEHSTTVAAVATPPRSIPPSEDVRASTPSQAVPAAVDPSVSFEQIIEAMLFIGGPPLTAAVAAQAIRGLTPDVFEQSIENLNRRYRRQNRPYIVVAREGGFVLTLLPQYRYLRERLYGGSRTVRLSQAALDVLAIVAYRQPVTKNEIDTLRGQDSSAALRQLLRHGLITMCHRGAQASPPICGSADPIVSTVAEETSSRTADIETLSDSPQAVRYGTTPRFLRFFGLASLDELPRLSADSPATFAAAYDTRNPK